MYLYLRVLIFNIVFIVYSSTKITCLVLEYNMYTVLEYSSTLTRYLRDHVMYSVLYFNVAVLEKTLEIILAKELDVRWKKS